VQGLRRERHAVVGANREREPKLPEGALEDGLRRDGLRREEPATGEQVARVLIRECEREAVVAVARAELALEVGGPEIVRDVGGRSDDAGMYWLPTRVSLLDQPTARQEVGPQCEKASSRVPCGVVKSAWR